MMMSQNAPQRLYLMVVGSMPEYEIPIVCYLVQTGDGKNILIDSGLPEVIPEEESEFENGQDVIEQLASMGLTRAILIPSFRPIMMATMLEDTRCSQRRSTLFSGCIIWMRRATHVLVPFDTNGISQWSAFGWWMGTRNCCRGWS